MRTFIFALAFLPVTLFAQGAGKTPSAQVPRLMLKTNAVILLNPAKQAFAIGADFRVAPKFSIDASAGAFFNSTEFAYYEGESYRGLRTRAGFKYYLIRKPNWALHLGLEAKYQDVHHLRYQEVFRQGQEYVEMLLVERNITTYGLNSRIGWLLYFDKKHRFFFEPFTGLGYQVHQVHRNLPPDAEPIFTRGFINWEYGTGTTTMPDVLAGVHIGVVLW